MKLLIIGGTRFVGRTVTEAALAKGHEVTLFNRGNTNPELFPEAEKLHGDRIQADDLAVLKGRTWDAVIDTCGYVPRAVELLTSVLADSVGLYTFISTISVYAEEIYTTPGMDETGPLVTLEDETTEEVTGETYGGLKVLCEKAAEAAMPGRVLVVRPGLIVGPYDPTDRFTYWPVNVQRRAEMLAPPLQSPMQVIDVRDLMGWTLTMTENNQTGIYNATGPDYKLTVGKVLEASKTTIEGDTAKIVEVTEDFLMEHDTAPWTDLPLWLPAEQNGISQVSVDKAIAAGLTYRPITETIKDTLAWFGQNELKTGISAERQDELLATWKAR